MRSRDLFFVNFFVYIYTDFTGCLYVSNGKCILYEFYVSLYVYLQWTMFEFNVMNGQYANLIFNYLMSQQIHNVP